MTKEAEENSRLGVAVQRMSQLAGGSEKMAVGQRKESTEVRKVTAKLTYRGRVNQREKKSAWLVACENFARVHAHVSTQNAKCHKLPSLAFGANPSPCLFFSSILSVVLCVSVKEKPLDDLI